MKLKPILAAAALSVAASEGIQYVDYFSILNNGKDGMVEDYTIDHCHPSRMGYNLMERFVVKEINKALGTKTIYYVSPDTVPDEAAMRVLDE